MEYSDIGSIAMASGRDAVRGKACHGSEKEVPSSGRKAGNSVGVRTL